MRKQLAIAAGLAIGVGSATAAFGLPWDIDMADSQAVKGYETHMANVPVGAVAQPNIRSGMLIGDVHNPDLLVDRLSPEAAALVNPEASTETSLAQGRDMYDTYCTPCHGDGTTLGPVAAKGRFPGVVGLTTGSLKNRPDGYIFASIKTGGASMPGYDWAMSDREMWATVNYVRTLKNAQYVPPPPPEEPSEDEEASE
jgi:mono/diheme cytochrome c family protein